ncbi:MAG: DUF853 family protein [Myxococcales bacterium]|nr:DUF853 family protein [Myxococcales bacterium]
MSSPSLHLGRPLDPQSLERSEGSYDLSPDALMRHAVCFGATGSGKTGLCIVLLEELIRAGVPIIAVDPKGDIANLALMFGQLTPSSFAPWIDEARARQDGLTVEQAAEAEATKWREGLGKSGIDEQTIASVADKMDLKILTPGSRSAAPVDVLGALSTPAVDPDDVDGWVEALRSNVRALLELVGIEADPVRDPRHIVLAQVLDHAWRSGDQVTLEDLVVRIVDPPFSKVGAFPLDTFLPRKDRMDLAVKLNGLLASPSFAAWSEGTSLDPDELLSAPAGKVAVRVYYLAHLEESERQLAATLLLTRLAGWSRRQPGSSTLRAVLLFDESWGYLPPHPRDPSTKRPLLQLLKQARAVGFGVVLATQNPVDLDYKAMSNAGTWFVGRLATSQDRDRVLDGADRQVHDWLDRMPKRGFWVRRPGSDEDRLMTTRWAMTWLRGPLTLPEVRRVVGEPEVASKAPVERSGPAGTWLGEPPPASELSVRFLDPGKARSPRLMSLMAGRSVRPGSQGEVLWEPALLARVHVKFDERGWESTAEELRWFFPMDADAVEPALQEADLFEAVPQGRFSPMGADLSDKALKARAKEVVDHVVREETCEMYRHRGTKLLSTTEEDRAAFAARVSVELEEQADALVRKEQDKVDAALEKLTKKRDDLEDRIERDRAEAKARFTTEVVNVGETIMGMLFGGRRKSFSGMASKRRQTAKAEARVAELEEELDAIEQQIRDVGHEAKDRLVAVRAEHLEGLAEIEVKEVGLERNDVSVLGWEVVWVPVSTPL